MLRRGLRTSPLMNEIASGPVHANAMTDQKMTSLRANPGCNVCGVMRVAAPNFHHANKPMPINSSVTAQRLTPPALFNHLPTSSPSTLRIVASVSPAIATAMKYQGDDASAPPAPPLTKSALPAAKYKSAGKYGRFDAQ